MSAFYARIAGKVYGPLDADNLKTLAANGKLARDDAISKDGKTGWTPAGNVKGLFPSAELLPAQRPAPISTVVKDAPPIPTARPAPPQPAVVYVQAPAQPPQQIVQQTTVVVNPHRGNTAAIVAAVLALLALAFCWIPFLGMLIIPIAILALLLAGIGLIVALMRRGAGLVASIGGGALALVAIGVSLLTTTATVTATASAIDQTLQAAAQANAAPVSVNPSQPEPATPEVVNVSDAAKEPAEAIRETDLAPAAEKPPAEPNSKAPAPVAPAPLAQAKSEWTVAPAPQQIGDARLAVVSTVIGKAPLKDLFGDTTKSVDDTLVVRLKVENLSASRKFNFRGFDPMFTLGRDVARLNDDNDNTYKRISFGATKIDGQVQNDSVYPGKTIGDVLVFEVPIENVQYLQLELPAENLGEKGSFRFQIPRSMIEKQADSDRQLVAILKEANAEMKRLIDEQDRIKKRKPTKIQQAGIDGFGKIAEEYEQRVAEDQTAAARWLVDQLKGKSIKDLAKKR